MACTPELNRLLFVLLGAEMLNSASEEQLLWHIRLITIRGLHKEVHQQNFNLMRWKKGESITYFLARLQTLAKFWEFTITCSNEPDCGQWINCSSVMLTRQIMAGLAIMEHQSKILAEAAIPMTLQLRFDRLVSLKMTEWSPTSDFSNIMHYITMCRGWIAPVCMHFSYTHVSQKVRTSPTPQYTKSCRGCRKYSYPNESMNPKDCLQPGWHVLIVG